MSHDKHDNELKVGDRVRLAATVDQLYPDDNTVRLKIQTSEGTTEITCDACCCECCDHDDDTTTPD